MKTKKLIIEIDEDVKGIIDRNGTNEIVIEAIEESSHCPACIHYVQRDVPNAICDKCNNRDELYRRLSNEINN